MSVRVLDKEMGEVGGIEGTVVRRVRRGEGPGISLNGVFAQRERADTGLL